MKKMILSSTIVVVVILATLTILVDNLYAREIGGDGSRTGNPYPETVKCTKIIRTHLATCACFTDPQTGKPEFLHQFSTSTSTYYRTATLCHFNYVTTEWCTETNPCIE